MAKIKMKKILVLFLMVTVITTVLSVSVFATTNLTSIDLPIENKTMYAASINYAFTDTYTYNFTDTSTFPFGSHGTITAQANVVGKSNGTVIAHIDELLIGNTWLLHSTKDAVGSPVTIESNLNTTKSYYYSSTLSGGVQGTVSYTKGKTYRGYVGVGNGICADSSATRVTITPYVDIWFNV